MSEQFKIEWVDGHREPQCSPDLRYPEGVHIDVTKGAPGCICNLPYPAKRCGHFYVECTTCGTNAIITTAGRFDDPRTAKLPCKNKPA